jgi:hypothetical protein
MPPRAIPGRRLVDLIGELERRLTGSAVAGLEPILAEAIPEADTYVLVLFDGLGHHQLDHPAGRTLAGSSRGVLHAPFPTTTTVSMATVATGRPPAEHGVLGHYLWMPSLEKVVNSLKWVTPGGQPVSYPTATLLPRPNTWERLAAAGCEPVTVQPEGFRHSPLTGALYRGCRFEGVHTVDEAVDATVTLARTPRRLVFTYFPQVDFAAHVWGQSAGEYRSAVALVDTAWSHIVGRLPAGAVAVGTADHGHLDYPETGKILIRDRSLSELVFFGDPRALFVRGDHRLIGRLGEMVEVTPAWSRDPWHADHPHPELADRLPDAVLLAPPGQVLLPPGFDKRLIGYHGGLDPAEV